MITQETMLNYNYPAYLNWTSAEKTKVIEQRGNFFSEHQIALRYIYKIDLTQELSDIEWVEISTKITELKFFPEPELLSYLNVSFGLHTNRSLKYFISFDKIMMEIDKINNIEGVYLSPSIAIQLINTHLSFKLLDSILKDINTIGLRNKDGTQINKVAMVLHKMKKQRNDKRKIKRKSFLVNESFFNPFLIDFPAQLIRLTFGKDASYQSLLSGRTENTILRQIFEITLFLPEDKYKIQQKKAILYDLFKLILPENNFKSEAEFEADKSDIKRNKSIINTSYNRYKAIKVSSLIRVRKKND